MLVDKFDEIYSSFLPDINESIPQCLKEIKQLVLESSKGRIDPKLADTASHDTLLAEIKVLRTELEESLKFRDDMSSGFESLKTKVEIAAKCKKGLDKNVKLVGLTPEAQMLRRVILAKKNEVECAVKILSDFKADRDSPLRNKRKNQLQYAYLDTYL